MPTFGFIISSSRSLSNYNRLLRLLVSADSTTNQITGAPISVSFSESIDCSKPFKFSVTLTGASTISNVVSCAGNKIDIQIPVSVSVCCAWRDAEWFMITLRSSYLRIGFLSLPTIILFCNQLILSPALETLLIRRIYVWMQSIHNPLIIRIITH